MATAIYTKGSGDPYIDGLLYGTQWTGRITYSFPDSEALYDAYYGHTFSGFEQVTAQQQNAIQCILNGKVASGTALFRYGSFSQVSMIDIGLANKPSGLSDLMMANTDWFDMENLDTARVADFPEPEGGASSGDVWFGNDYPGYRTPTPGSYEWLTHIHEFGHAMGLRHGHEAYGYLGNAAPVPQGRDAMEFTVMTYRSYVGGPTDGYVNEAYGFAQTLMMLDIAALQHLYGANFGTNSGNTVYRFNASTGEMSVNGVGQGAPGGGIGGEANRVFLTIWDGGGVDTYDFSNYGDGMQINLNPGSWSLISQLQRAYLGNDRYASGNVYNALQFHGDSRSLIENAIGGAGDDRMEGNAADNTLTGNGGNDTLIGAAGADRLYGGTGDDTLGGGVGNDTLDGGAGKDVLKGNLGNDIYVLGAEQDTITDTGGIDTITSIITRSLASYSGIENLTLLGTAKIDGTGNALANVLTGNSAANTLDGGAGNDMLDGGAGKDILKGGLGDDIYVLGAEWDTVTDTGGTDTITSIITRSLASYSTVDNLTLLGTVAINGTGNALANNLTGNGAANLLDGGAGNDRLLGGQGNDTLTGGAGRDCFVFDTALNAVSNVDKIIDFSVPDDTIILENAVFTALRAAGTLAASAFTSNLTGHATTANQRIVYESDTGKLFYDANGSAAGGETLFATLKPKLALTYLDFSVI